MSSSTIDVAALLAQMAALTEQVAKLSAAKAAAPAEAPKTKKVSKKSAAPAAAPAADSAAADAEKPKRALNEKIAGEGGWNAFVAATLEKAPLEGWPEFTDVKGTVWPASVANAEGVHLFPDGKKMTRIYGGLVYASYLKNLADPDHAAKSKATRERRDAQIAAKAAEKASASGSDGESDAGSAGSGAAAKPASSRSEKAKARFADPAAKEALRARLAAGKAAKKAAAAGGAAAAAAEKPAAAAEPATASVDLNFESWEFEEVSYAKNARGDVITEEGDWVGRFNGESIDKSVPKPSDIDAYIGLE
jgi:hypothetical protein